MIRGATRLAWLLVALGLPLSGASAREYKVGAIEIMQPWTRATPKGAAVAGGYMKIANKGTSPDRLIGGTSEVAGRFEVHEMAMNQGVMTMRPLNGLDIAPGQTVEFKPGSLHIMFMDLKRPLAKGERVKATLMFERAGRVEVEYVVEALGAPAPVGHSGH